VPTRPNIATTLERALGLLDATQDVVAGRPVEGDPPEWAERRGWSDYLLGLSDDALDEAARAPARWFAACSDAPDSLRALSAEAAALCSAFEDVSEPTRHSLERHVKRRKQAQLEAFAAVALREFSGVTRIVDLGSGHGHLTRALARALRPQEALGIDWNDKRVTRAVDLAGADGPRFVHGDASQVTHSVAHQAANQVAGHTWALAPGDLVVGLHPCGDLGDALVSSARDAGAHVLAVSCCFQETTRDAREALSQQAQAAGFSVPKHALGLANLSPVSFEGSGSLAEKRTRRRSRLALRLLLQGRGVALAPGAESRGVPKDRVRHGLADIAAIALSKRGLSPATAAELAHASSRAALTDASISRLALPRHALSRVLELGIVLDRARLLEESGWRAEVAPLFSSRTSPRNLAIVAVAPE
jgi:hypothetical protein